MTRQLIGVPGSPFAYRGSIGPWPVPARLREALSCWGILSLVLRSRRPVRRRLHPPRRRALAVEVNPRYTASVEVLELALGRSLLIEHFVPACRGRRTGQPIRLIASISRVVGKAILFASRPLVVPDVSIDDVLVGTTRSRFQRSPMSPGQVRPGRAIL